MAGKLRGKANGSISVPKIERVKISDLNRADYNPRKISGKARSGLAKSLEKFGIMNLIIWNKKTGNVVGGHQRLDIIEARGETETDVVVVSLEPKDEVALNIALNNQALAGDYEASALDQLLAIKDVVGEDFDGLCFDELEKELEKVAKRAKKDDLPVIEEPPPLPDVSGLPEIDITQIESVACIRCPKCKKEWRMDKIVQS